MSSSLPRYKKTLIRLIFFAILVAIGVNPVEAGTDQPINPGQIDSKIVDLSTESFNALHDDALPADHQMIDKGRIETFTIQMPQFEDREKTIIVYLPSDYASNDLSYPVIYLQGAQDLFLHSSNSQEDWRVNEALFEFFAQGVNADTIFVGIIDNYDHYWDEYSPWVNENMHLWVDPFYADQVEGGEGDAYLAFLIETLKPEIDKRYRTLAGRENTAIGGYEMGGLISIYAGLTRPEIFSRVMALSPAIWFAEANNSWLSDNRLLNLIEAEGVPEDVAFVINVSSEEREIDPAVQPTIRDYQGNQISYARAFLEGAQAVIDQLLSAGLPQNKILSNVDINFGFLAQRESEIQSYRELSEIGFKYHIPIFWRDGFPHFIISMEPYLNRTRTIWVYLPPNYFSSGIDYPVLYVMDALRQFNPNYPSTVPSFEDWYTDEQLDELYDPVKFPGIIVVGIEHSNAYRWSEYTLWPQYNMDNWVNEGIVGIKDWEAEEYLNFIVNKLKPRIDSTFRTKTGREFTAIGGASRGAYFSIIAGLTHPETFSKVMAMSPAVWLAEGQPPTSHPIWFKPNRLYDLIKQESKKDVQFFVYVGGNEEQINDEYPYVYLNSSPESKILYPWAYRNGAERIAYILKDKGYDLDWEYNPNGTHHALFWRNYLDNALIFFRFYKP